MFLLFLCLGAASVKAQVRIGGNAAPNSAAVLDLNATDAATGTKGLALPRVSLASNTAQITTGVANLTGMLIYNTNATLGAGIYFWSGSAWVKASLPATTPADSGKFLMSDGNTWRAMSLQMRTTLSTDTYVVRTPVAITWSKVLDTTMVFPTFPAGQSSTVHVTGLTGLNYCLSPGGGQYMIRSYSFNVESVTLYIMSHVAYAGNAIRVVCYQPSN